MARLRELPGIGVGLAPSPEMRGVAGSLTLRDRLRVQARVRAGRPAWDEPSARYAIELGRAQARIPRPFGKLSGARSMWIVAAIMWLNVAIRVADGSGVIGIVLCGLAGCLFSAAALFLPTWERNAPRAEELNEPLLTSATPWSEPPPVTRGQEVTGMGLAALSFGVPFGVGTGLADGSSWITGVLAGAFFGPFMIVCMRQIFRRGRRPGRS